MNYKVGLVSLGCEKNRVDAEIMLSKLKDAGYTLVSEIENCDIAIINTCGFIEASKKESIDEIFNLIRLKQSNKIKAIIVTGCLSERYKQEIRKEIPEIDAVVGIGSNKDIVSIVKNVTDGKNIDKFGEKNDMPLSGNRVRTTPNHYAYLKIADGCDNCCTYCAIPLIRGHFRSRTMEDILSEANQLANEGVKELLVIAQDTTRYGEDLYGKLMLPELLKQLCKIDKIEWIRILYCYPDRITDELIDVIASEEKILNYIDLPLQHCNEKILKAMNRTGNKESLTGLLSKIRSKIPDVILRTTFIVGFPGETDDEFNELCEFSKEISFDRMGCFCYSPEEGTRAADFENQIDEDTKRHRQQIIMDEQMSIMEQKSKQMVGKKIKVLVEGYYDKANCYFGRSYADSPDVDGKVYFEVDNENIPQPGDFIEVLIDDCIECDLIGDMI